MDPQSFVIHQIWVYWDKCMIYLLFLMELTISFMFLFLISLFAMLFYELSLSYCPDIMRFQTGLFWPETESVAVLHIECFFPGSKKQNFTLPTYMTNSIHSLIYFLIHIPIGSDHSLNNAMKKLNNIIFGFLDCSRLSQWSRLSCRYVELVTINRIPHKGSRPKKREGRPRRNELSWS